MIKKIVLFLLVAALALPMLSCALLRDESEKPPVVTESSDSSKVTETKSEVPDTPEDKTDKHKSPVKKPGDPFTVCIDPGHGYNDPGCTSDYLNGAWEREIVRDYAEALAEKLEADGIRVVMLHTPEKYVTSDEIAEAADEVGVDCNRDKLVNDSRFAPYNRSVWANVLHRETYIDAFVSIHVNTYAADENVHGTRIYYCSETEWSADSAKLSSDITAGLGELLPEQRTRYYADKADNAFVVTKCTEMPSVLIEMGFATNPKDAENILSDDWRDSFTEAVKDGIAAFSKR